MTSATWGDEKTSEATRAPTGGHGGNEDGGGKHTNNKGTPHPPKQVTFGDTFTENVDAPADYKMMPALIHNRGPRGVEANTARGKGTPLPHETIEWGNSPTEALDNDEQTGNDGDDNDIAARQAAGRPGRGGMY